MSAELERDPFPGAPRILFFGEIHSTHAQSWIGLLDGAGFNVRAFALPTGVPGADLACRTYVTFPPPVRGGRAARALPPLHTRPHWLVYRVLNRARRTPDLLARIWLRRVVLRWRPHIVHVFGLQPAGLFWHAMWGAAGPPPGLRTVLQLRGGSDLAFDHDDPAKRALLVPALAATDAILSDNELNYAYLAGMGIDKVRRPEFGRVPGTGGIDVDGLAGRWAGSTAARRDIFWPKAYESPWSKAVPVLEALRLAWPRIAPCRIRVAMAVQDEVRHWIRRLPADLREAMTVEGQVPRDAALATMLEARAMLAPSLVDGTPNVMWEAMAAGALPIVSPLPTLTPLVEDATNVLFARNLYPEEIASALVRAMTDDALAARMAAANLEAVRRLADRATVAPKIVEFYRELAAAAGSRSR